MISFFADLHIHSCLSPCADILMLPNLIAKKLIENNIEIASITDHNSTLNLEAFSKIFKKYGIFLLPGIEIQTVEEVHILGYFKNTTIALKFQKEFEKYIPNIENMEELMGYQLLCNEKDEYIGKYKKALSIATTLNIEDCVRLIKKFDGIAVAAHIDKSFGVVRQLGFIPDNIFDAIEIYTPGKINTSYVNLSSSDAHYLDDIRIPKMKFLLKHRNFEEIKLAISGINGRMIKIV